jgi:hypothetical protein
MVLSMDATASELVYSFRLTGSGAIPPNGSQGIAWGTITLTGIDVVTLDITYSGLGSGLTKVEGGWGWTPTTGATCGWYPPADLPPSGHWTNTINFPADGIRQSIELGLGYLSVGTVNYPMAFFGEIGGYVTPMPVPEPVSYLVGSVSSNIDRQTGLFLQQIVVTNTSTNILTGLRVFVTHLPAGARLVSATGTNPVSGAEFAECSNSLAPGQALTLTPAYYSATRETPLGITAIPQESERKWLET